MYFSPRKFLTSMRVPSSLMAQLMGKSVDSPHLVHESHGDSLDHIVDMAADSSDGCQLFLLSKPFFNLEGLFVDHVNVDGEMAELLLQGSPGSFHRHLSGLHRHLDFIRDGDQLGTVNILHVGNFF